MAQIKEFALKVLTGDANKSIEGIKGKLDGATKSTSNLSGGFKKANFSVKAFGKALIATGIGAFVALIGTLVANLQNSEGGFNRVQKVLKQLGVVAGNVTDIFYSLGTSLFGLITGDFELMKTSFEEATDRIKNFGDETRKEIALQGELADKTADLAKVERELVVERAKANRDRASLLEKAADKENFTAAERIKFLKEAAAIDEEITNKEIEAAKTRLEIKEQENSLSESSKEDLEEEAALKAALIQLETQRLTKQKTVTSQITGALREEQAERKAIAAEDAAEQKAIDDAEAAAKKSAEEKELARLNSIQTIRDGFKIKIQDAEAQSELEKLELQKQRDLDALDALGATEEQKLEVKKYYSKLEQGIADDDAKAKQDLEQKVKDVKIQQAQQGLMAIQQLAGQGSAIGKAAALTNATIAGIEGVQNAYKTAQASPITAIFPAYPVIQAGLAAAFSAAQIKSIVSVPKPNTSGAGGGVSVSRPSVPTSQPPSFNVVGAGGSSQIAEAIGQRDEKPVKAYVVSDEVTTAQSLDRNIIENASI